MNSKKQAIVTPTVTIPYLLDYVGLTTYFSLGKSRMSKLVMAGNFVDVYAVGGKNYFKAKDVIAWIDSHQIKVGA